MLSHPGGNSTYCMLIDVVGEMLCDGMDGLPRWQKEVIQHGRRRSSAKWEVGDPYSMSVTRVASVTIGITYGDGKHQGHIGQVNIWYYSKNPYPLRNCMIPNEATVGSSGPHGSWTLADA